MEKTDRINFGLGVVLVGIAGLVTFFAGWQRAVVTILIGVIILICAYHRPSDLTVPTPATYRDWEWLVLDFNNLMNKGLTATLTKDAEERQKWEIFGGSEDDRKETRAICRKAGSALMRSPQVAKTLDSAVLNAADDVDRWLLLLKEDVDGPIIEMNDASIVAEIKNLARSSKTRCTEYSIKEKPQALKTGSIPNS